MATSSPALHCPHRPPCPGCPRFGQSLDAPASGADGELAALAHFAVEASAELTLEPAQHALGYRQRARLAVRGRASSPKLGIFQAGSHRIADIPRCLVQHPRLNEAAAAIRQAIRETRASPYADAAHAGLVRYVQLVLERGSQTLQVVVVLNAEAAAGAEPLLDRIGVLLGARLHSLFVSLHAARSNAILGPACDKLLGPDAVCEQIAGAQVFFPPDAFGQANLDGYERIVAQIGACVDDDADVVELYAGVGAIGLSLLPRAARVRFNELAPGSLRGLRMGIDALPQALRARTELLPGPVRGQAALVRSADVVIADPPRKGLDPELCAALHEQPPRRLLYLSCDVATFLRDARVLIGSGGLRLARLWVYDLFPFTGHLEVLGRFEQWGIEASSKIEQRARQ